MRIGDGPAAVTEYERRKKPLFIGILRVLSKWEGAASRMNRKSEDLPGKEHELNGKETCYTLVHG